MKRISILVLVIVITCISFTRGAKNAMISKVDAEIALEADSTDHLIYADGPITWDDFRGFPDTTSQWDAMIYSGINLKYVYKRKNGVTQVRVLVAPYMNKAKSWVKETGYNDRTLLHEQRHFDLTATVAHELAVQIKNTVFANSDFKSTINSLHAAAMERLTALQNQYDTDTHHGYLSDCQEEWNHKLDMELQDRLVLN